MQILIESHNIDLDKAKKANIKLQVEALFSRVRELVHSVKIRVSDANGPKGGIDKECVVIVRGKTPKSIVIRDTQNSETHAIGRALQRANYSFLRKLKNKRIERKKMSHVLLTQERESDDVDLKAHGLS